jgi:formate-dependent nitrite reductase cytochrome c552 subunit
MLRDDVLARLVENSDRLANNKALLRRIVEQHNFTQFENMEKIKGKKYFDRLKEVDNDISNAIRRHDLLAGEYEKASEK